LENKIKRLTFGMHYPWQLSHSYITYIVLKFILASDLD
jgi:hypothetical protein